MIENWPEEHRKLRKCLFWDICGTREDFHLSSKIWNGIRGFLSRHLHSNLVEDWQGWQIHLYYYVYIICVILVSCESNSSLLVIQINMKDRKLFFLSPLTTQTFHLNTDLNVCQICRQVWLLFYLKKWWVKKNSKWLNLAHKRKKW